MRCLSRVSSPRTHVNVSSRGYGTVPRHNPTGGTSNSQPAEDDGTAMWTVDCSATAAEGRNDAKIECS